MTYRDLKMTPKIILPVALALFTVLSILAWQIQSRSYEAISVLAKHDLIASAEAQGNKYSDFVGISVYESQVLGASFTAMLTQGHIPSREIAMTIMQGPLTSTGKIVSASAYFEPNGYDGLDAEHLNGPGSGPDGRFAFTVTTNDSKTRTNFEGFSYWSETKARKANFVGEPYESTFVKGQWVVSAASPVIVNGLFRGIITSTIGLNPIIDDVRAYKIYTNGFGQLITQKGTVIAHHDSSLLNKNLFEVVDFGQNPEIIAAISRGESFFTQYDRGDGIERFTYFSPFNLRNTDQTWYFVVNAPISEVFQKAESLTAVTLFLSLAALVVVTGIIYVVVSTSVKPIGELAFFSGEIARGNMDARINDDTYGGEVRDLSQSLKNMVESLIANMEDQKRAQAEEAERARTIANQNAFIEKVTETFRRSSSEILAQSDQASDAMGRTAQEMTEANKLLGEQASAVAIGSEQASTSVENVASAAEQLSASIREIGRQVEQSNELSSRTVDEAQATNEIVQGLVESSGRIGEVVRLINDIASQTNLLALNATIEAARAGEAGKGFAVVANEVKSLANQTAKATDEIGSQIGAVQNSTLEAVKAIGKIVERIGEISHVAAAIAAAVEEQAAATAEIANSVQHAAAGTHDVSSAVERQRDMVERTGEAAGRVASTSAELSRSNEALKNGLVSFLSDLEKGLGGNIS